jgi:branched-chain amino acid transport system ATP-binding protein
MSPGEPAPALESRALTIRFGGHVAVDGVSCAFAPGTLSAIVGPNGAGKTTYFNLLSGQLRPSAGRVFLKGDDITALGAPARTHRGIGRAFQLTNLFPNLSVLENVRLAVQSRARIGLDLFTVWSTRRGLIERAERILARTALAARSEAAAGSLPHGDQRKLEVAILIALEPDVFMFDEPTAGMSVDEVPVILDLISDIKKQRDKTILLVEHKMDVVRSLADRIVVLHNGRLVADGPPAEVIAAPVVQQAYLGLSANDEAAAEP